MGKVLFLPLLLLILTVIPGGALGTSNTEDCNTTDIVIKDGGRKSIKNKRFTGHEDELDMSFLRIDKNLEVMISVEGSDGSQQTVLVPIDEKCYQHDEPEWQMLKVWSTKVSDGINVGVSVGNDLCKNNCIISGPWQTPVSLCVTASGCSEWKLRPNCPNFKSINKTLKESAHRTCKTPLVALTIVILVLVLVLTLVILVTAVLILCFKKRQQHDQLDEIYDTLTFQQSNDLIGKKDSISKDKEAIYEKVILYDDAAPGRRESAHYVNAPLYDDVGPEKL